MVEPVKSWRSFAEEPEASRLAFRWAVSVAAAILLLAVGYALFAVPKSDDLCFASSALSPLAIANEFYLTWSGRWLGMLALAALSQDVMGWQYQALVAGSFLVWGAGFFLAATTLRLRNAKSFALLMLAVFWSSAPDPTEAFYWLSGVVIYAPPFLLGIIAVALLVKGSRLAFVPAIAAVLFNEMAGLILIAGLLPFASKRRDVQLVILATLAAMAVVVFSPGNLARAAMAHDASALHLIWYVVQPYDSAWSMLADIRLWALGALVAAIPKDQDRPFPYRLAVSLLLVLLVTTVAIVAMVHIPPKGRMLDLLYSVTICAFVAMAAQIRLKVSPAPIALLLTFALAVSPSIRLVLRSPLPQFQPIECDYSINRPRP